MGYQKTLELLLEAIRLHCAGCPILQDAERAGRVLDPLTCDCIRPKVKRAVGNAREIKNFVDGALH